MDEEKKIIHTDEGATDGQVKCPKCGATDISLNTKMGKLRCNFCRHEFEPEKSSNFEEDIENLQGEVQGSGAADIDKDAEADNRMVTLKCSSCGAEVVIDTSESTQARCHWCRNTLSINQQIPNGAVPDVVLPFSVTRNDAKERIEQFVGKRLFFAHPKFKAEFTADNVMGVYLPYMIVDLNTHATLTGEGEVKTREYEVKVSNDRKERRYDADVYHVARAFDMTVKGLTIESSADKLDRGNSAVTNNIVNSIMPFDTENCQKWNSNFLKGYTSEKRDVNVDELRPRVKTQAQDIARLSANSTLQKFDRGVRWDDEQLDIKGQQWRTAYLPVWLYSYQEKKSNGQESLLHYVAVNARTCETMGSVPINKPKLFMMSVLVEILCFIGKIFALDPIAYSTSSDGTPWWPWLIMLGGFGFYAYIHEKYRNSGARHHHESETEHHESNVTGSDQRIGHRTGLTTTQIQGANNHQVRG